MGAHDGPSIEHLTKLKKRQEKLIGAGKSKIAYTAGSIRKRVGRVSNATVVANQATEKDVAKPLAERLNGDAQTNATPINHDRLLSVRQTDS